MQSGAVIPLGPPTATDVNPSAPGPDKTAVALKSVQDINKVADAIFALSTGTATQVAKAKQDWKTAVSNKRARGEKVYIPNGALDRAGISYWTIGGIAFGAVAAGLLIWWLLKRK
jgi:hypothetical protein